MNMIQYDHFKKYNQSKHLKSFVHFGNILASFIACGPC
jgi:hypothetical protein